VVVNDREAQFRGMLEAHGPALRRIVRSYARPGADQDDLAQDVAVAIWNALPSFRGESSERTFAFRIAHYRGVTHLARRRARAESEEKELACPKPSPEALAADREDVERLFAAMRELAVQQRQVLTLALEGMSHQEIGECLGTGAENVAVRLSRARAALRRAMEES
jgi:RNA polymerase sigma-70 factor (ECF subfamily)